jgi:hypothetical protein
MVSKTKGGKKNFLLEFMDVSNEERIKSFDLLRLPSDHNLADNKKTFIVWELPCFTAKTHKIITSKT